MGVTKFKPARTPRTLDAVQSQRHAEQKKTVQNAQSTVRRSKELVAESVQIVADVKRRTGS